MDLLLIIFNRLLVFLMHQDFPETTNHILIILRDLTKIIIPGLTILIFLLVLAFYIFTMPSKKYDPYPFVIQSIYFDFWLQTVNLCIPLDQEIILFPNVRKIKKGNDSNQKHLK